MSVRRRAANTGVDVVRAIAGYGIDRGIRQFQRIAILRGRIGGDNYFTACDAGRFDVIPRPRESELLKPLDRWLDRFRPATGKTAPARAGRALRGMEEAILRLCQRGAADDVQRLLIALGEAEATVAISTKLREGEKGGGLSPSPLLSPEWLSRANDDTIEFRLAAALASVGHSQVGPFRRHLEPIDVDKFPTRTKKGFVAWAEDDSDPAVVWGGGGLVRNLNAVLSRRLIDVLRCGKEQGQDGLFAPLDGQCWAALEDVQAFINDEVDVRRIEALLKGLMLLDWTSKDVPKHRPKLKQNGESRPDAAYALLKLCHLAKPLEGITVKLSPQIARRAQVGDLFGATKLAAHRLRVSGVPPAIDGIDGSRDRARRTAAALLFPISDSATQTLRRTIESRHLREEPDKTLDAEPVLI